MMDDFIPINPGEDEAGIKPWEQRTAPGMGGGSSSSPSAPEPELPGELVVKVAPPEIKDLIDDQTRLAFYPQVNKYQPAPKDLSQKAGSNEEVWSLFKRELIYDTRRVTLECFHLFEWFPLSPGKFFTPEAEEHRRNALSMMFRTPGGHSYFDPMGKANMLRGGIGAVRLRPRMIAGEPYYFMSVSSNGVCHEGFPVLIPRRFYAQLKPVLLSDGAVPVTLSGEMRYLYDGLPSFFEGDREIPSLYLHVDELAILPSPRQEVSNYTVSAAISFIGQVDGNESIYATFSTFNPAKESSLNRAINWMEQYYVTQRYKGVVITDFDEMVPRFPGAVFNLPDLMAGKIDQANIQQFLKSQGLPPDSGKKFFLVYKEINTQGGAYIEGDVNTGGGAFTGRDQIQNH